MEELKKASRRNFLKQASVLGAAATVTAGLSGFTLPGTADDGALPDNYTFLFQGDSITDGNRGRSLDWNHVLGHGYAYLISSRMWYDFPGKHFHFF